MFLFCAVFTLPGIVRAEDGNTRERTFVRALEAFDKAKSPDDFRQAAALFEALNSDGYQNGAVCYDIGNCYMRAGDYGKAIAAYRKARFYRPRDPFLDANLRQALNSAPGRLPQPPQPWWRNIFFWSDWVSYTNKFTLALCVWVLGAALASVGLLLRSKRYYWFSSAAVFAAVVFSADAAIAYVDVNQSNRAVITAETTARKGNGLNWDPAFDKPLKDGAELTIKERRGEWVRGEFGNIGEGWVQQKYIVE